MISFVRQLEMGKPQKIFKMNLSKKTKLLACGTFTLLGLRNIKQTLLDKKEKKLKKERLAMPVYELS